MKPTVLDCQESFNIKLDRFHIKLSERTDRDDAQVQLEERLLTMETALQEMQRRLATLPPPRIGLTS